MSSPRHTAAEHYVRKPADYFGRARTEIAPVLPARAARVLEIGAGDGATLAWVRPLVGATWVAAAELVPDQAALARTRPEIDEVYEIDVESEALPIDAGSLDLVLCLDVLEHLRDPWAVVRRLTALLAPGGALVASIPNLRYYKALLPLVVGRFDYQDSGVMDRTHLRFFTRRTAAALVAAGGLRVDRVVSAAGHRGRFQPLRRVVLALGAGLLDQQYLVRGVR